MALDARSQSFAAGCQHGSGRPLNDLADAHSKLTPIRLDGGEMLGEDGGRAAGVEAGNQDNIEVRKRHARIGVADARVIPALDHSREDVGVDIARKLELAFHAGEVVGERDHASHRRHHDDPVVDLGRFGVAHEHIAAREVDGCCREAGDAFTAADRVIADRYGGGGAPIGLDPFLVEQRCECRAGAL
jgi:hypothetical protein